MPVDHCIYLGLRLGISGKGEQHVGIGYCELVLVSSGRRVRTMKSRHASVISIVITTLMTWAWAVSSASAAGELSYDLIVCDDPGSPAHAVGVGLELLIKLELLPTVDVNVASSTSSRDESCLEKMKDNAASFAVLDRTVLGSAPADLPTSGGKAEVRPLLIAALWRQAAHFVIARSHLLSGTIGDIALLSTNQFMVDPALRKSASQLLAKAGITTDHQADLRLASPEALVEGFDRGTMIGFAVLEMTPSPLVAEFLSKTGGRATLLGLSERDVLADGKGWRPVLIPADSYPDIDQPIETFGNKVMLAAEADIPDETVYQVTKTMFDNLPKLNRLHDVAAEIRIDQALVDADLPLHPGAARYYREIGVLPYEAGALKADRSNQ